MPLVPLVASDAGPAYSMLQMVVATMMGPVYKQPCHPNDLQHRLHIHN